MQQDAAISAIFWQICECLPPFVAKHNLRCLYPYGVECWRSASTAEKWKCCKKGSLGVVLENL